MFIKTDCKSRININYVDGYFPEDEIFEETGEKIFLIIFQKEDSIYRLTFYNKEKRQRFLLYLDQELDFDPDIEEGDLDIEFNFSDN